MAQNAISPTRQENFPEWYQQVIKAAGMAENSSVRGCMIIKPWGYALWENMQQVLDRRFKETGHKNAYFPLFIPLSLLSKEAEHVDGFATECAVVTHHRLEKGADGKLHPAGELEEPLVVRPTSEMIINETFARWVQSYRDLPLLINQWANVVRWEMRPRLFMRTAEFLWQEGHTVHADETDARAEADRMLEVYRDFMENWLALPVIPGAKSAAERFPGAVDTLTCEAMMQDGKALQAGTSHFLGQNFARAAEIQFLDKDGERKVAWTTSWGVSTRMIGGMIMAHSDDDGLVLPPKLAPAQVAILPILRGTDDDAKVRTFCDDLHEKLKKLEYAGRQLGVEVDDRDMNAGQKKWDWVKKGVPLRIEVGGREVDQGVVSVARRDDGAAKLTMSVDELLAGVVKLLDEMQAKLFARAKEKMQGRVKEITAKDEFYAYFKGDKKPDESGFALCWWDEDPVSEKQVKTDLGVTIRCLPHDASLRGEGQSGMCVFSGKPAKVRAIFAKAY